MKSYNTDDVYTAALKRIEKVYSEGHRLIVAFSAGKDSGAVLELCIEAARNTGNLPVECWMRDEEIMFPGTYEYAERMAIRPEVKMYWFISGQPIINMFNRAEPYYWVFDDRLDPDQWMRKPPSFAIRVEKNSLDEIINPTDFPPPPGKMLYVVMGIRAQESRKRYMLTMATGGEAGKTFTGARKLERHLLPIYDWTTRDIWHAVKTRGWDYNQAYDTFSRYGIKVERQRIGPPVMSIYGVRLLEVAAKAWPEWFERLCIRLPGVRLGALYGRVALEVRPKPGDTWQQTYQKQCIDNAPAWIAERATIYRQLALEAHAKHSTEPIKEIAACPICPLGKISWKAMTQAMYSGDPFLLYAQCPQIGYVQPEFFRKGAGDWHGKPTW